MLATTELNTANHSQQSGKRHKLDAGEKAEAGTTLKVATLLRRALGINLDRGNRARLNLRELEGRNERTFSLSDAEGLRLF